jgi:hypothetical protein
VNLYRTSWRPTCSVVVLAGVAVGVCVLPFEVWVLVGLLATVVGLTAVIGGGVDDEPDREHASLPRTLVRSAGLCAAVVAVLGFAVVLKFGVVLLVLLFVIASPPVVLRCVRRSGSRSGGIYRPPSLRSSTQSLCLEWRSSYVALSVAQSPDARLRIVKARQRFLDELERRDPDGLRAWLESGPSAGGDPGCFLRSGRSDRPPAG